MQNIKKNKWYVGGLHFECAGCGDCCSGPNEGFIWLTLSEINSIADFLKIEKETLAKKYLRRIGIRFSIIEHQLTKDCIFLQKTASGKQCVIYPVRPKQCRTWPFWQENLISPDSWNEVGMRCPGINRGRKFTSEEIDKKLK